VKDKYFGAHEFGAREEEVVKTSSDRTFGYVFAGFFGLVAIFSFVTGGHRWPYWLAGALIFAAVAVIRPGVLAPLNKVWMRIGLVLHMIVSPLILGLLFYVFVTPVGLLMRLFGKDPLRLRMDPQADSYWIRRDPAGPAGDSFTNQF
jgi:hypothetical protein